MLSIIVPTLNEEDYLPIFFREIKKQSFKDYEVIIADANSKDRTIEIAQGFGAIVVSGGLPAKGRNEGAKIAKGDMFLFMDADNVFFHENFLEDFLRKFKKRNLDIAIFPLYLDGNKTDKILFHIYNWWVKSTQSFLPHATNSILIKKEIHEKMGGFDETITLAEDHEYSRRAAKYGKFGFIETEPVLTSARRFEGEGRSWGYLRCFLSGIHMLFLGPVRSDVFKYQFVDALKRKRNKKN